MSEEIDRIQSENNRKELKTAQRCNEIGVGLADTMASLILPIISSESRNHYICPVILLLIDDQLQNEEHRVNSESSHDSSETTIIEISLPTEKGINIVLI